MRRNVLGYSRAPDWGRPMSISGVVVFTLSFIHAQCGEISVKQAPEDKI